MKLIRKSNTLIIKKIVAIILLIVSLFLIAYPFLSNVIYDSMNSNLIDDYSDSVSNKSEEEISDFTLDINDYNKLISESHIQLTDPFINDTNNTSYNYRVLAERGEVMGILEIPSISLEVPIFFGTSDDVLQRGIGHLNGTSIPAEGKSVHSLLCGHTGSSNSRLFTDLDKVEKGERFYININNRTLTYEVVDIMITDPSETDMLTVVNGKNYTTLYTCTPYGVNTHRLLVKGELTEFDENKYEDEKAGFIESIISSTWFQEYFKALLGGIFITLIINTLVKITGLMKRKIKRRRTETGF